MLLQENGPASSLTKLPTHMLKHFLEVLVKKLANFIKQRMNCGIEHTYNFIAILYAQIMKWVACPEKGMGSFVGGRKQILAKYH